MSSHSLEGQVAVVTGASAGIGRATATALARAGSDVVLAARNPAGLEETARIVRDAGRRALVAPTDVTSIEQVASLARAALAEFGRVDVLVNVAGGWAGRAPFVEMDIAKIAEMADVDVKGTMYLTHALLPRMIQQRRGTIVGIAAVEIVPGREEVIAYAAIKSALAAFHRGLRREVQPLGIRVGVVYPGWVANDLEYAPDPASLPTPEGRPRLAVKDIAEAVLYMVSAPGYCVVEDLVLTPM